MWKFHWSFPKKKIFSSSNRSSGVIWVREKLNCIKQNKIVSSELKRKRKFSFEKTNRWNFFSSKTSLDQKFPLRTKKLQRWQFLAWTKNRENWARHHFFANSSKRRWFCKSWSPTPIGRRPAVPGKTEHFSNLRLKRTLGALNSFELSKLSHVRLLPKTVTIQPRLFWLSLLSSEWAFVQAFKRFWVGKCPNFVQPEFFVSVLDPEPKLILPLISSQFWAFQTIYSCNWEAFIM